MQQRCIEAICLLIPLLLLAACVARGPGAVASKCNRVSADKQLAESVAESGNLTHMFNLGRMAELVDYCWKSDGYVMLEPDLITAYMWFEIASHYEHPKATQARDRISTSMTENEITEARKRVTLWIERYGQQL